MDRIIGSRRLSLLLVAAGLAGVSGPALAADRVALAPLPSECGYQPDAPIFGLGVAAGTDPTPILAPLEQGIIQRGDKSSQLKSVKVPAMQVEGTIDYAMMRLSQASGRPIWVATESGKPGPSISMDVPATNLADAFDRMVAGKGVRWRYDGEKVYLLGGREWTIPMPSSRDVALAVREVIETSGSGARIDGGMIRFYADDEGSARVSSIVRNVYAQTRLNPYDVQVFRVFPTHGAIDWSTLASRTDSVQSVSFSGKGATVVLEASAGAVIDAFLAREGDVRSLGSLTMVAPVTDAVTRHAAGCGPAADPARWLELTGGRYEKGLMSMRYAITGGALRQSGSLSVAPGAVVVLADGEPRDGAYMVAVVRPRVVELQVTPAVAAR